MKTFYNTLLAIFMALAITSCSDDDSNHNDNIDPSAKYVDNAITAKQYGYEGDVKMIERYVYPKTFNDTLPNNITDEECKKTIYYFDINGALTKSIHFNHYSNSTPNSTPNYETTYTYDSIYRETKMISYGYNENKSYITETEYNDTEKTATLISYNQEKETANITDLTKIVYKLDADGKINQNDIDSYYSENNLQDIASRSNLLKSAEADLTGNYIHKVERDSKNNILSEYFIEKEETAQDTTTEIIGYTLQTITYYDGTVSKPANITKAEFSELEFPTTIGRYNFKGKVKSAITKYYVSTGNHPIVINYETEKINSGKLSVVDETEFDTEGYCTQEKMYNYNYLSENSLEYSIFYTYEYDSKYRLKTVYNTESFYNDGSSEATVVSIQKTVYTYDDVNNTSKKEIFNLSNTSALIANRSLSAENKDYKSSNTPNYNLKEIKRYDSNGSLILTYDKLTSFDTSSGTTKNQTTQKYFISDITYY